MKARIRKGIASIQVSLASGRYVMYAATKTANGINKDSIYSPAKMLSLEYPNDNKTLMTPLVYSSGCFTRIFKPIQSLSKTDIEPNSSGKQRAMLDNSLSLKSYRDVFPFRILWYGEAFLPCINIGQHALSWRDSSEIAAAIV